MSFTRPADIKPDTYIKIVRVTPNGQLVPCSGGNISFRYNPPKKKAQGWVPGAWTPSVPVNLCTSGYHVTMDPEHWMPSGYGRAFWAQATGESSNSLRKAAFSSIRLLRPVQIKDLNACNGIGSNDKLRLLAVLVPTNILIRVIADIVRSRFATMSFADFKASRNDFPTEKSLRAAIKVAMSTVLTRGTDKTAAAYKAFNRLYESVVSFSVLEVPYCLNYRDVGSALQRMAILFESDDAWGHESAYDAVVSAISIELRNAYGYNLNWDKPITRRKDGKYYPRRSKK